MYDDEVLKHLGLLLDGWENEIVEFKEAGTGFSTRDIGQYYSALANEANLRNVDAGWLIFGVRNRDRTIVGTNYREGSDQRLQSLKNEIANGTETRATFREIYEIETPKGRVLLFEVPPAPRGIPIAWNGHYYARNGESLGPLALWKLDEIRGQGSRHDWSAEIVPQATYNDLDPEALIAARRAFAMRRRGRSSVDDINTWSTETFLERARLTSKGAITRTTLLLLGKAESAHFLSPLLAEITWTLATEDRAYEHFGLPFLLSTTKVYERIRNYQLRMLQPGTLIQTEVQKYDQSSVLEAIHNCVAHADYTTGARIVVQEYSEKIVFISCGEFHDGSPDDYILHNRVPRTYRNTFLVNAMVELNMIDRLGSGIATMTQSQARRFLPLPDYDFSKPGEVALTIHGATIDENFGQTLMSHTNLALEDVLALDRVQKGLPISKESASRLRRARLIEGRKPHLQITSVVAAAADVKADYVRTRAQDDAHYEMLIVSYLDKFGSASRHDISDLLWDKLSDALDDAQKRNKVSNLLAKMRRQGTVTNHGSRSVPVWKLLNREDRTDASM